MDALPCDITTAGTLDYDEVLNSGIFSNNTISQDNTSILEHGQMVVSNILRNNTLRFGDMMPVHRITNSVVIVLSGVTVAVHIPLLIVLSRCKKMTSSLRMLSINFVTCSLIYHVSMIILTSCFLLLEDAYSQTFYDIRALMCAAVYVTSVCATGGLALERYFRVSHPLTAKKYLKNRNIRIYIVLSWMLGFIGPTSICLYELKLCDFTILYNYNCKFELAMNVNKTFFFFLFITFGTLICFSCYRIFKAINSFHYVPLYTPRSRIAIISNGANTITDSGQNHNNESPARRPIVNSKRFLSTRYVLKIMLSYVVLNIPVSIHSIIFLPFPELKNPKLVCALQVTSYVCSLFSFYITQHFYIWKFKECKLIFLLTFCSWIKGYKEKIFDLKIDVYDIKTVDRTRTSSSLC